MVNLLQWVLVTLNIIVVTGDEGVKKIDLTIDGNFENIGDKIFGETLNHDKNSNVGKLFANGTKLTHDKENERPTRRRLFSWLDSLTNKGDKISEKVDKVIKKQEKNVREILENINNSKYDHIDVVGSPGIVSIHSRDDHYRNFRIFTNITGKLNGNVYFNGVKWGRDENNQWTTEKNEYNAESEMVHPETQYKVSVEYTQNNTNIHKNYTDIRIYPFDTWHFRKQVNDTKTGKILSDTVENINVNDLIEVVESPGMITIKSRTPHERDFKTFYHVKGNYEYINIHGVKWARGENSQWTTARSDAVETKNVADEATDIEQDKEYESTLSANVTDTSDGKDDFEEAVVEATDIEEDKEYESTTSSANITDTSDDADEATDIEQDKEYESNTSSANVTDTSDAADEATDIEQDKEYESNTSPANVTDTSDGEDDFEEAADEATDIEQDKEYESTTLSANITDTSDGEDDFEEVVDDESEEKRIVRLIKKLFPDVVDGEAEEERIVRLIKKMFPDGLSHNKVITYTYYTGQ